MQANACPDSRENMTWAVCSINCKISTEVNLSLATLQSYRLLFRKALSIYKCVHHRRYFHFTIKTNRCFLPLIGSTCEELGKSSEEGTHLPRYVTGNPIFPSYKTMSRKISKCYRFSNDIVACGVDRDVMAAYSSLSSGHEVEWLPPQLPKKASSMQ